MVALPEVRIAEKGANHPIAERFAGCKYWEEREADLFSADLVANFPHVVPGMLQHMCAFEFSVYRLWLQHTVKRWDWVAAPTIIPTTDPAVFWVITHCDATVYWSKRECAYQNEYVTLLRIADGKIAYLKEYANPISYYDALGIRLPAFVYDPIDHHPSVRMPEGAKSAYTLEQNIQRAVQNFVNPIAGAEGDEPIYAHDVVEVCPFAPYSMTESYAGTAFDVQTEWMMRAVPEWNTAPEGTFYQGTDPGVIIVESLGYGATTWSDCDGHYTQRELQIVFLEEGKVKHFRVYFNPLNKFSSMNQSVPTFPYFNY